MLDAVVLWRLGASFALLVCAAFFAGSETALFSLSRVQKEAIGRKEDGISRRISSLLSQPRRLIVTIIVANELAWVIAVTNSYVMNSLTTFAVESGRLRK